MRAPPIAMTPLEPGVLVATTGAKVSPDVVRAWFEALAERARAERFALIIDASPLGSGRVQLAGIGASAISGLLALPPPTSTTGLTATAMVIPSFDVRAMTSVVVAAVRPGWPTRVVRTLDEARAFAADHAPRAPADQDDDER